MAIDYHLTQGLPEDLRIKLNEALEALETLRDRGKEAVQYEEVESYRVTPMEVYEHAERGASALFDAVSLITDLRGKA